jgi:S1-C subfamily serine protease
MKFSYAGTTAAIAGLMLGGCASILNSGKGSLTITSEPPGATVLVNGAERGSTPLAYDFDAPDPRKVSLELRMSGRQPVLVELHPKGKSTVYFADAMLLGIPYIADAKSKAAFSFPVEAVKFNLYKAIPTGRPVLDLPVATLENALPEKAVVGKTKSHVLTVNSRELSDLRYPQAATSACITGMQGAYVAASRARPGTTQGDEQILRAKVLLQPVLKGLNMQLVEKKQRFYGNVHVQMDWKFLSGVDKDSVLFTVNKETDWPVLDARLTDVFADALKDAARQLLDVDSLYERIADVHASGLVRSKGDVVHLEKSVPVAFADRNAMIPALVKGVVTVEMKDGHGSGFLITNNGYIITNAHVVGSAAVAKVRFEQGFTLEGQVVKVNRDFDVALIKVPGNDLPALALGGDNDIQLGQELYAIGTPLDEQLGQSVTRGIMSGRRDIDGRKYIQTDVSINPGNSGGPLINADGKVVGVATLKIKATGVEGIGFGVPISTALEMLNIEFAK